MTEEHVRLDLPLWSKPYDENLSRLYLRWRLRWRELAHRYRPRRCSLQGSGPGLFARVGREGQFKEGTESPMRKTITAAIAVLLIASCQQERTSSEPVSVSEPTSTVAASITTTTTAPDPTPTPAAPTSTTAATTTTAAVPPPDADPFPPEQIVGTWRTGLSYITFYESGALEVRERPDTSPYERGTWEIDGAILSLTSDPGGVCNPGIVGRYWIRWADDRSRILATTIEDACGAREQNVRTGFPPVAED